MNHNIRSIEVVFENRKYRNRNAIKYKGNKIRLCFNNVLMSFISKCYNNPISTDL